MFDSPFDFLSLVIAIVAFIFARKAFNQAATLRARLDAIEAAAGQARPAPPPLTPLQELEQTLAASSPGIAAEQPTTVVDAEAVAPAAGEQTAASAASAGGRPCPRRFPGPARLRGAHRHPLGGLGRRPDAGARRLLHGPLFDRCGPARARRAHHARRRVRAGAAWRRRMDAPQGEHLHDRSAADRQYPGDPHRRRHRGGVRDRLCRLCAVRFSRARDRVHPARAGGARHARRGAAARTGAGRPRHRRRLRHADSGFFGKAGLLGAVYLSRHRHRGGLRAGADQAVALARGHHHRVRAALDLPLPAMRPVDGRTARVPRRVRLCARGLAGGVRIHVRPAGGRRPDRADLIRFARGLSAWARP